MQSEFPTGVLPPAEQYMYMADVKHNDKIENKQKYLGQLRMQDNIPY